MLRSFRCHHGATPYAAAATFAIIDARHRSSLFSYCRAFSLLILLLPIAAAATFFAGVRCFSLLIFTGASAPSLPAPLCAIEQRGARHTRATFCALEDKMLSHKMPCFAYAARRDAALYMFTRCRYACPLLCHAAAVTILMRHARVAC